MVEYLSEEQPASEASASPHGCLTAFVLAIVFGTISFIGFLWLGSVEGTVTALVFGSILTGDLIRAGVYGLGLMIPSGLVALFLRDPRFALWRGIALALLVAGGQALTSGMLLAIDRSMDWPGIPDWLRMVVTLLYGIVALVLGRKYFLRRGPGWQVWLGLALGGVTSAAWLAAGALGTSGEVGLSLLEALAYALIAAVILALPFAFDQEMPARHPFWSALIVSALFITILFAALATRGWFVLGFVVLTAFVPLGLIAGVLLTLDEQPDPRRLWWAAFAFLFVAFALPFMLTEGFEAEWMAEEIPAAWSPAMLIELTGGGVLGLLLLAIRQWIARLANRPVLTLAASGLAVIVMLAVYALLGQPGVQPDVFFVVMKDQADTSFAQDIEDRGERITAVYETLTEHASTTQADLRTMLDQQGVHYTPYYIVSGIEVEGNPILRAQIAARPDVARILNSPHVRPLPDYVDLNPMVGYESHHPGELAAGIAYIEAEKVWDETGVIGEGIILGNADSGADWTHPSLQSQYLGADSDHDYTWFDPWFGSSEPEDTNGHGTHTTGTMIGQNGIGVAPGAQWIACRNLGMNLGNPAYYLDCMQFLFAPFPQDGDPFTDGDPARGAHITNNSWGCPREEGCDALTLSIGIEHLRNAGQMMVVSAGNEGPDCDTIWAPANADAAFSVGAVDPFTGEITDFSSRGPITGDGSGRIKPDIVAPGQSILSSVPGGGFMSLPGTSMAGPHVAGLVALLWSANPDLIGAIDATEQIIEETAHYQTASDLCGGGSGTQNNVYGYGVIDAYAAVQEALNRQ
jgi:subtilisin family serine protease